MIFPWVTDPNFNDFSMIFSFLQISRTFHEIQWFFHDPETDLNFNDFSRAVGTLLLMSKLVKVKAWGHQATHHYLSKCSLVSTLPYVLIELTIIAPRNPMESYWPFYMKSSDHTKCRKLSTGSIGIHARLGYYIHENIGINVIISIS